MTRQSEESENAKKLLPGSTSQLQPVRKKQVVKLLCGILELLHHPGHIVEPDIRGQEILLLEDRRHQLLLSDVEESMVVATRN